MISVHWYDSDCLNLRPVDLQQRLRGWFTGIAAGGCHRFAVVSYRDPDDSDSATVAIDS
ncbi:hypothetical protein GCM10023116_32560 [Kistimonas scapharcae]|uniref:Uncharacterized protein n=1 Tax=Kistimonas scapharcae TaxID=1036133 RepID=A0ABP8V418_9GAMM